MDAAGHGIKKRCLVDGFLRDIGMNCVSQDIIRLIMEWICIEWVHLIQVIGIHWKANLMNILPP